MSVVINSLVTHTQDEGLENLILAHEEFMEVSEETHDASLAVVIPVITLIVIVAVVGNIVAVIAFGFWLMGDNGVRAALH